MKVSKYAIGLSDGACFFGVNADIKFLREYVVLQISAKDGFEVVRLNKKYVNTPQPLVKIRGRLQHDRYII